MDALLILDLLRIQKCIKFYTYVTHPLAESIDWFVFKMLLLFGGAPNDGRPTEGRDGPPDLNCEGREAMTGSFFSNNFGGPIRSPSTRLLLVDLRAISALSGRFYLLCQPYYC